MFCPKCGSILIPKEIGKKTIMVCSGCGFKSKDAEEEQIREIVKQTKSVEVVEKEQEHLPLVDIECSRCHHKRAYYWEIQTRAADEAATQFFKCEKCKRVWRKND